MTAGVTTSVLTCSGRPDCRAAFVPSREDVRTGSWERAAKVAGWRLGQKRADGTRAALCKPCGEAAQQRYEAVCALAFVEDHLRVLVNHGLPLTDYERELKQAADKRWDEANQQGRNGRGAA